MTLNDDPNALDRAYDLERHQVLTALINTAHWPQYVVVTDSITIGDLRSWLTTAEAELFWENDGTWQDWSDCLLCEGVCDFRVQILHNPESLYSSFRGWWLEIAGAFRSAADYGEGEERARRPDESDAAWLRRTFHLIDGDDEDHSPPILFRVHRAFRDYRGDGGEEDAYVWYTARGFRERRLDLDASLPTKELADSWRADHLGLISADEATEERVRATVSARHGKW
jgi:hypothetical protein